LAREPEPLLGTSHFRVLIGRRELGFCEVGRLSSVTDLEAPPDEGPHSFETLILRRALTRSSELFDWRREILSGSEKRRTVTIQQLEPSTGAVVNTWRLEGAWPCRWSGPAFDARATAIAYEELELAFDDIVWQTEGSRPRTARPPTQGA
jgi:hypothetical protein